jgi:hypothetical protein
MNREKVAQLVRERLRDRHPGGVTIDVVEDAIREKDGYWYVPVRPSAQPPHTFEYYDVLTEVETELSLDKNLKLWLVPSLPEEATSPR